MVRSKLTGKFRNRLLAALSPEDLALLEPHLTPVRLDRLRHLEYPNRKIEALYFVEHGMASIVAANAPNTQSEVGVVGCEGVTGLPVILSGDRSPHSTYMQIGGNGQRMSAAVMQDLLKQSRSIHNVFLKYAQTFLIQATHTAVANAKASIEVRLARWLLMAHDRIDGDEIHLTHDLLALMLGTRRPGVTDAVHALETRGLIQAERGVIILSDRRGLEQRAGRFYGVPESEYDRMIG